MTVWVSTSDPVVASAVQQCVEQSDAGQSEVSARWWCGCRGRCRRSGDGCLPELPTPEVAHHLCRLLDDTSTYEAGL